MKLRNLIKVVEKAIAPEPLEEIKEEDIECAIDEQVVPCEELQEPEPPYTGYPAPAYLVDDPWFGPAPTLTEKQMDYMQMETEVRMQEDKEREESGSEPDNIHQLMYEMAQKCSNYYSVESDWWFGNVPRRIRKCPPMIGVIVMNAWMSELKD